MKDKAIIQCEYKRPQIVEGADRNGHHVYEFNGFYSLWTLRGVPSAFNASFWTAKSVEEAYLQRS